MKACYVLREYFQVVPDGVRVWLSVVENAEAPTAGFLPVGI